MASIDGIQAILDQFARDQLVRDEGIRRAFEIMAGTIERQTATLNLISQQVADARQATDRLSELLNDHFDTLGPTIRDLLGDLLEDRGLGDVPELPE